MERLQGDDGDAREKFDEALFGEAERRGQARGDNVSPEVIAEEMELFQSFSTQHQQLSQGVK